MNLEEFRATHFVCFGKEKLRQHIESLGDNLHSEAFDWASWGPDNVNIHCYVYKHAMVTIYEYISDGETWFDYLDSVPRVPTLAEAEKYLFMEMTG
jgi:hypothetical protein